MAVTNCNVVTSNLFEKAEFFNISLLITDIGVSMRKSPSFDILSRQSYAISFFQQSSKCKTLHCCPIQIVVISEIFNSFFENFFNCGMNVEILWPCGNLFKYFCKFFFFVSCFMLNIFDRQ